MDIKSAEQSFQNANLGEHSFDELIDHLSRAQNLEPYHLSILIGKDQDKLDIALQKMADASNRKILDVDANEVISKIESETYANLDTLFKRYYADESILHLQNGSRLCGVYTGYTHSKVKYATPQERYFLKKVQQKGGFYVIDINDDDDSDTTIRRAAQSIVHFPKPDSIFKTLLNKLKGVSVHGHQIETKRPEHYGKTSGNF